MAPFYTEGARATSPMAGLYSCPPPLRLAPLCFILETRGFALFGEAKAEEASRALD